MLLHFFVFYCVHSNIFDSDNIKNHLPLSNDFNGLKSKVAFMSFAIETKSFFNSETSISISIVGLLIIFCIISVFV